MEKVHDAKKKVSKKSKFPLPEDFLQKIGCFMCNTPLRPNNKTNLIPANLVAKIFINLWKLPCNYFDQKSQSSASCLTICKKCSCKLRRLSKVHFQLQTLLKLIAKLQSEIEDCIRNASEMLKTNGESPSKNISGDIHNANSFLRRKFLQGLQENVIESSGTNSINSPSSQNQRISEIISKEIGSSKPCENITIEFAGESDSENDGNCSKNTNEGIQLELELINPEQGTPIVNILQNKEICCREISTLKEKAEENNSEHEDMNVDENYSDGTISDEEQKAQPRVNCEMCRCTFKDEIGKNAHYKRRHEGKRYPFSCEKCIKQFKSRRQLVIHSMIHTGENPFICEHCGKGFRLEKLLVYHLKNKHIFGQRDFKCDQSNCTKEFLTESKLKAHLATHTKNYLASCTTCHKGFASKALLIAHNMVKHSSVNPWRCPHCSKTFSCQSALQNHIPLHNRNFKYKCPVENCGYGCPSKSDLERHKLSHRDGKFFKCTLCGNDFKHKRSLIKHLRVHAGEKRFKCNSCDKAFIDRSKLTRHEKTHGIEKIICKTCHKGFRTEDALKSHKKLHSNISTQLSLENPSLQKKLRKKLPATRSTINVHENENENLNDSSLALLPPQDEIPCETETVQLVQERNDPIQLQSQAIILGTLNTPDLLSSGQIFHFPYPDT